jgi:hypothetical protein
MIPIPEWLVRKVGAGLAKAIMWGVCALLAIGIVVGIYQGVKHFFVGSLETEVKVEHEQTGAAIKSGQAAVEIIGNRQAAETAGAANVQEAQHEVDNSTDPGAGTDAGIAGLHRVRSRPAGGSRH